MTQEAYLRVVPMSYKRKCARHKPNRALNMKFSMKDFFSKCYQIRLLLMIWSHLLMKPLTEGFDYTVLRFYN